MRKSSPVVDIKLRIREPLRAAIQQAAKSSGVSMNAEMARRLQASFESDRVIEAIEAAKKEILAAS